MIREIEGRITEREQEIMEKYTCIIGKHISIKIGHQQFRLRYESDDPDDLYWMRWQIAKALLKLIDEEYIVMSRVAERRGLNE
jgi:hypothetical protein